MENFDGVWAIVKTAGGSYIGRVTKTENYSFANSWRDILEASEEGQFLFLKPAFEYTALMGATPSGPQRLPLITPVSVCLHPIGIWLRVTGFVFFDDMHEDDVKEHKGMITAAMDQLTIQRAEKNGISIEGASDIKIM